MHAAICTQTLILKYDPDFILNIGVAGGIDENIDVGDIVIADCVVQHDFDSSIFPNRGKGGIPGIGFVKILCSSWILIKAVKISKILKDLKTPQRNYSFWRSIYSLQK
ncbi:MAG: hypothetical protein LBH37_03635 [Oscillospiraceae bacterium]|nr:hypothetical protein [Oscillospiraceae bacterium]